MRYVNSSNDLPSSKTAPYLVWILLTFILISSTAISQAQPQVNIHSIQTNLPNSPYLGKTLTTEGIVVAVVADGFYIENSPFHPTCTDPAVLNCWDDFDSTSEGIFVYTKTTPDTSYASIGNLDFVTGTVTVSNSSGDRAARGTEIQITAPPVRADDVNYTVPPTIAPSVLNTYTTDTFGQWLPFEGMRITLPVLITTSGTGGTVATASQTAVSNGQFWGVLPVEGETTARLFRAAGISALEPVPAAAPPTVSRWSGNPSLLFVDGSNITGTQPPLDLAANSTVTNLTGVVDYHGSSLGYTALLLDNDPPYYYGYTAGSVTPGAGANGTPAVPPVAGQVTIATQNLDNFYDLSTISSTGFANRVAKAALAVVNFEHSPDILAVQEIESLGALNSLAAQIVSDGGPTYTPCWFPGNDSSGLTNGFLVNAATIDVVSCDQLDQNTTYNSGNGTSANLFARPPLALVAGVPRGGSTDYQLTIVNSELVDPAQIADPSLGPGIRAQRAAQAEELSTIIQQYQSAGQHVVALGGFNSFEFSDGFVDTLGSILGSPVASDLVTLPSSTFTVPPMVNLTTLATNPETSRYTFVHNGSAEQLDHILVSADLAPFASISYARFGADFPLIDLNDSTTALHASSHDGVVGYLAIPYIPQFTIASSLNPSIYTQSVTFTATATGTSGVPTGTVTFSDGTTTLCNAQPMTGGVATCSTSTLTEGQHTINAAYSGAATYQAATASLVQTVTVPVLQFSLTSSLNPSVYGQMVTFTATTVGPVGVPTGTITFNDGTSVLCVSQSMAAGVSACATNALLPGQHSISAVYSGNAVYQAMTANLTQTVNPLTFSLTVTPGTQTIYTGQPATYTVNVAPGAGFTANVALTCSGLPSGTTYTLTPSTIAGGSGIAQLSVQTSAPSNTAKTSNPVRRYGSLPLLAGLLFILAPIRLRRRLGWLAGIVLLACLGAGMVTGCGGSGTLVGGTAPGTYTLTVTGTAPVGNLLPVIETATVSLKVTSLF